MGGASAPDIITYIGVPLAVLGVLPTMYTCANSLATQQHMKRILRRNHVPATTRSSLLSGIIEVEVPRKSLHPLERSEPGYFSMSRRPSSLKGGSWTLLNWRELSSGNKCYRLQYHDELVQPQAEIGFETLVAFLLDRGAVPCQQGFADLRNSGLWTPAGTKLLLSPCTADAVLRVSSGEDSDGILSLMLEWRAEWDTRGPHDLPPYWTRIHPPSDWKRETKAEAAQEDESVTDPKDDSKVSMNGLDEDKGMENGAETISQSTDAALPTPPRSSIRFKIGTEGLLDSFYEDSPKSFLPARHLRCRPNEPSRTATWFTSAATALRAHEGGLWAYAIPTAILTFSKRETVPCGVLVLLGALADDAVPTWRTPSAFDDKIEAHGRHVAQMERLRRMTDEMRLPPEQQRRAREARVRDELMATQYEMQRKRLEEEKRREVEVQEALRSQRLGVAVVAEAMRSWLIEKKHVPEGETLAIVVERVLWEMIREPEMASAVVEVLEMWQGWAESGGMTKAHFELVKSQMLVFAYAACVLYIIAESAANGSGRVVSDMQECLRMWKNVRLG